MTKTACVGTNWDSSNEDMRLLLGMLPFLATCCALHSPCTHAANTRRLLHQSRIVLNAAGEIQQARTSERFWKARDKCWRPDVYDVERISWGKPAKKKGTGSRGVPHRLNQEERRLFDQARRKGFLEVGGSGWRSQRREAPLLNTYRSLCDARGQACVVLHKGNTGIDEVVIDLSPLRLPDSFAAVAAACVKQVDVEASVMGDAVGENRGDKSPDLDDDVEIDERTDDSENPWLNLPIYHLSPYFVAWELPRSEAKVVGKKLAEIFATAEPNVASSRKPVGVKPGKNRRSGGYGIG